jgi:hypothetical protein
MIQSHTNDKLNKVTIIYDRVYIIPISIDLEYELFDSYILCIRTNIVSEINACSNERQNLEIMCRIIREALGYDGDKMRKFGTLAGSFLCMEMKIDSNKCDVTTAT